MAAAKFHIHLMDSNGRSLPGVLLEAASPNGNWQGVTDCAGNFLPFLAFGRYDVSFSKPGFKTATRVFDLQTPPTVDNPDIQVGLESEGPGPVIEPTRDQVCDVFCGFQGIMIHTEQYGPIPAFGPETSTLNDDDLISYCQQMKALGFTHVEFDISWRYSEADYSYPVPGRDLTNHLDEVCRRVNIIVEQGMHVKLSLAGDGLSVGSSPYGYNDPQGWTYGYEWLMENLGRILFSLRNYEKRDLTKFIIFVPGYDGVFYGWGRDGEVPDRQPERVINFGKLFRTILPNGYLGIEHTIGKIPVGEGPGNWEPGGVLDSYDTLLGEFETVNYHDDSTWQILGRMCRPYIRPADQPAGDDLNPAYYLADCTRGKRFYIIYELKTYRWVRGCSYQEVLDCAKYFNAMAPTTRICALLE